MSNHQGVISLSEARQQRAADEQARNQAASRAATLMPAGLVSRGAGLAAPDLNHPSSFVEQAPDIRPRGLVDGFVKTCQRWGLDRRAQAILLGYKDNEAGAFGILSGHMKIPSQDVKDRMSFVLMITLTLGAVFSERADAENAWLRAKRSALGGKAALDVLLTGKIADLIAVMNLARSEREV